MAVTAQIAVNTVPGSNDNVPLDALVTLSNVNNTGVTTWEWAIVSQPTEGVGPVAALSSTSTATVTFTPNREGSYLIRLVVNKNLVDEASNLAIVAVRELETGNRVPAIMETTENSDTTGWAGTAINDILRRVTRLTDGGTYVAIADVPLTPGDVVHMSGMTTIASGLPGSRQIPTVNKALATSLANVDGPLGVMIGNRNGQQFAVSAGEYCRVMVIGGLAQYPLEGGGLAGAPVYVSNTGTLSGLPGNYIRQIGDIAAVHPGDFYDISISAVAGTQPSGVASGDLSGNYPDPTVSGIGGRAIDSPFVVNTVPYLDSGTGTVKWATVTPARITSDFNYSGTIASGTYSGTAYSVIGSILNVAFAGGLQKIGVQPIDAGGGDAVVDFFVLTSEAGGTGAAVRIQIKVAGTSTIARTFSWGVPCEKNIRVNMPLPFVADTFAAGNYDIFLSIKAGTATTTTITYHNLSLVTFAP